MKETEDINIHTRDAKQGIKKIVVDEEASQAHRHLLFLFFFHLNLPAYSFQMRKKGVRRSRDEMRK